jgi:phosphate/sulfate permease
MTSKALIKKTKTELLINFIIGIGLLIAGILLVVLKINLTGNDKVIIALSIIPFCLAISSLLKIYLIKKYPAKYVEEYDERLVATRDRADALSLKIIRYFLYLAFLGYSFVYSSEIFKTFAWWLLFVIIILAIVLPPIILAANNKYKPDNA